MSIARQVKAAWVRRLAHLLEEMYGSSEDPHNTVTGPLLEKPTNYIYIFFHDDDIARATHRMLEVAVRIIL